MQRYFVKGIVSGTTHSLEFSKEQIHQLKKVMRMKLKMKNLLVKWKKD